MITAVLDTNVLVSGFVGQRSSSAPAQVLDAWRDGLYTLVPSAHIVTEVARTLDQPYFRERLTSEQIHRFVTLLRNRAQVVPITAQVTGAATHPEDDLVLATAVSARAQYLVTGDKQLLNLMRYSLPDGPEVSIVRPRAFLGTLPKG